MACEQKALIEMSITGKIVKRSVKSCTFSTEYINIMVNAAMFNILYRRLRINENDFKLRTFKGIPFVVAKDKDRSTKDPRVKTFLSTMKGITEAIKKKYLKVAYLFLKDSNAEVLESYSFHLYYKSQDDSTNKYLPDDVKEATKALLTAINSLQDIEKLDENTGFDIEFIYNDETPLNYEPFGFGPAINPYCITSTMSLQRLGLIHTGYHKLIARRGIKNEPINAIASPISLEETNSIDRLFSPQFRNNVNLEEQKTQSDSEKTVMITEEVVKNKKRLIDAQQEIIEKPHKYQIIDGITISDRSEIDSLLNSSSQSEFDYECPCHLHLTIFDFVTCTICKKVYHSPCAGFMNYSSQPEEDYKCYWCGNNDTFPKGSDSSITAVIRLIVYSLIQKKEIPHELVNALSLKDNTKLVSVMKDLNIFDSTPDKLGDVTKYNVLEVSKLTEPLFKHAEDSQFLLGL